MTLLAVSQPVMAEEVTKDVTVNIDVNDVLDVLVDPVKVSASGDVNEFLRTSARVTISTNKAYGALAQMTTKTDVTSLVNSTTSSITIPTLGSNVTRDNFPTGYWGVSSTDTVAGDGTSTYMPLVPYGSPNPIPVLQTSGYGEFSRMVYFGMKAGSTQQAGTYANTVVIAAVANNAPVTPPDPIKPDEPEPSSDPLSSPAAPKTLAYSRPASSEDEHESPQGEEEEYNYDENVNYGSNMIGSTAVVLAGTVAAGLIIFVASKKRREEDEE